MAKHSGSEINIRPEQAKYLKAILSGKYRYALWGGSIRANKTWGQLIIGLMLAKIYPRSRWLWVMEDLPTIKRNLLPSFFNVCPPKFLKQFNHSDHTAIFQNDSEFLFMPESFNQDKELNRFKGLEINGAFIVQAEGVQKQTFYKCVERIGQWPIDPMPPMFVSMDANPSAGWIKSVFYNQWKAGTLPPGYYFQQADIMNTPGITPAMLENFKAMPKELYDCFVLGNWDAVDDVYQLIPSADIYACAGILEDKDKAYYLGVDVGHMGADKSIFTLLQGPNIVEQVEFAKKDTVEVSNRIIEYITSYKIPDQNITVDSVGVGAGVVDQLFHKGYNVIAIKGGAKDYTQIAPDIIGPEFCFAHWKSYSYWLAAHAFKTRQIGGVTNETLISDTQAIKYFIRGEKEIWTESKEDLKKRIQRSCDYFDSLVYAIWSRFNARMDYSIIGSKDLYTPS